MSKTARTSTTKHGRRGRAKLAVAAKRGTHAAAKPHKGRKSARAGAVPVDDVYVLVTETACVQTPDFDLEEDDELDDLLEDEI